ncbi:hypothetical protein COV13_02280 [Candidatus Woesearchaeota archaeon CG10_big_fil_rev_8_21_14_0_10_32_9]|nr:MAG: hypothetical protein COV13_02280 [Candidatus Woesearchaeota archaeon CG10_big_fil_rev_8_21_14_0_10_32_9]
MSSKEILQVKKNYKSTKALETRKSFWRNQENRINAEEEFCKLLQLTGTEKILDVGCGYGDMLGYIKAKYTKTTLVGIDNSENMIKTARSKYNNIAFEVADVQKLPFKDKTFDVVIAKHMLYHVTNIKKAFKEIHRVLKPEGRLIISLNTLSSKSRANIEKYKQEIEKTSRYKLVQTVTRINTENYPKYYDSQDFKILKEFKNYSYTVMNNAKPLTEYISTFREFFIPTPSENDWKQIIGKIRKKIDIEIKKKGPLEEVRGFGIILFKKNDYQGGK